MPHGTSRLLALLAATMVAACVPSAMKAGHQAELLQEYDRAVVEYSKVVARKPDSVPAHDALQRAKLRASQDHLTRGRRLVANGKLDDAVSELQMAADLNPTSADVEDALRAARAAQRSRVAVNREGKTELETLIQRARELPSETSDLPTDRIPAVTFRDASARTVYTAIGRLANLNVTYDPLFREQNVSLDLRDVTPQAALDVVSNTTRNFYRVIGPRTVIVIPDTPDKRREYEEEVVKTFYISNADLKETVDALRTVIDARRVASITGTNSITIKDTPERVDAAGRLISAIDKARPEVVIEVELLEVSRSRLKEFGLQIASPGSDGISGTADANRDNLTLSDARNLSQSDIRLTNLPALYYRLLKNDTNTRTLANPQLRTAEGVPANAHWGDKVPVPQTTFSPIATGGVAQQPITSYAYENIGVNIAITPRTHHDDEVSLALKVEITSISGTGFGGLPTFGNRSIDTVIRLHDGETNLLAGLIRDEERKVARGIPGLSDIPVIGPMFTHTSNETTQTDVIMTLTPHIIRVLDLTEDDLRAFKLGREESAVGAAIELPVAPRLPQPAPAQQPAPPPPPVTPGDNQPQRPAGTVTPPGGDAPTRP
ncbi:MAG TPA: secretin N-terminal domain-containing protein [Vicinamibacterales bacterium]|nr:secretin N-terminal domain-containing protein [Vicinamibacterales bacterium]